MPPPLVVRKVRFEVRPWGNGTPLGRELLPYVDDVSLVDLVSGYEHAARYDVAGEYAGLVLDHFNFGDLASYLTGQLDSSYWARRGAVALLGCECGEVGCWPLEAEVLTSEDVVTWRGFRRTVQLGTTGASGRSCSAAATTNAPFAARSCRWTLTKCHSRHSALIHARACR